MFARRQCLLPFCLVLLLASDIGADAATWKKYNYPADGFEVEFSGTVKVAQTEMTAETAKKVVRSTDYMQEDGSYVYIIGASLVKDQVNFDNGVKSSFEALKCKTTTSDTPLNLAGGRARELRGADCMDDNMRAEARYFTTEKWFYQVIFIIKKDGDLADARRFLQSFKLTGK